MIARSATMCGAGVARRLALFDEVLSAFVVVVGVMGEDTDRHTPLRVPDGERFEAGTPDRAI